MSISICKIKTISRTLLMNRHKFVMSLLIALVTCSGLTGQGQKKMTPADYDRWHKIKNQDMSSDGNTVIYTLEKETGDKTLCVYRADSDTTYTYPRCQKTILEKTGAYVVFTQSLSYDSTRTLKRKKTAKDKMPTDSLVILSTNDGGLVRIPGVSDVRLSEKWPGYCFYLAKWPEKEVKPDTTQGTAGEKKKKAPKPVCEATSLVIRHLPTGKEDTIAHVKEYTLARDQPVVAYSQCTGDSVARYTVWLRNLKGDSVRNVADSLHQVAQMTLDNEGSQLAFLALTQKSNAPQKPYILYLATAADTGPRNLTDKKDTYCPSGWLVSGDRKPSFSESGKRLFFGTCPLLPVKDTTKLDDEIVQVEIWHHDSPRLYTQMENTQESDKKKHYTVMYNIERDTFLAMENEDTDKSILSGKGDGDYALLLRTRPYEKAVTWLGETAKDMLLLDMESGNRMQIATAETGNPAFSPTGKYVYWWSRQDSIWKTFHTSKKVLGVMGLWSVSAFYDELNDVPQKAGPYGLAGWLPGDTAAVVYDRYDLWRLNPEDAFSNICMTDGRMRKQVFRLIDTDTKNDHIDTTTLLLHRFNETDKGEAYYRYSFATSQSEKLMGGDFSLTKNVMKADSADRYLFTKQTFTLFPDLLLGDSSLTSFRQVSHANPHQAEYAWGNARLFTWTNYRGQKNEGILVLPPGFTPDKKYPLIVNFYERSSDELHRHRAPEAHRSSINYSYYANQGYVIFNPDIAYTTGQPGEDCFNAVESGVDALIEGRFIDEERMALQGHSWGGYQIAYLLTRTNRYRCAEAGAPVVNMVSAYGGIRWESGMSRMFQYEKQQSRLGVTLWDNPELYHKNSPVYKLPEMNTPVLIMHNDEDGAVPWYQGIEYYMALRRLGKPAWLLNYNGEPHWPVKWQNRLDFNIRMEQFFYHYLMDGPMPLWMKEGNTPLEKGILPKYEAVSGQ